MFAFENLKTQQRDNEKAKSLVEYFLEDRGIINFEKKTNLKPTKQNKICTELFTEGKLTKSHFYEETSTERFRLDFATVCV